MAKYNPDKRSLKNEEYRRAFAGYRKDGVFYPKNVTPYIILLLAVFYFGLSLFAHTL